NESGVTFNTPMINPCRETSKTRLPIFQILSRITFETNTSAGLFEDDDKNHGNWACRMTNQRIINWPARHSERCAAKSRNPAKEPNVMPRGPSTPPAHAGCAQDDRRPSLSLFFSRVASHQLALSDHMTFHRGIHLAPFCPRPQIQFAIE